MATKKRPSSQSRLLNRAVKAGRSYLREAERRLPPDVRRQIDRGIKDGQRAVEGAIKQLRSRLDRTASQVDLEKALKRLDGLTKQVQQMARSASSRPAATAATATAARRAARKPATRTKARTAAAPKATATRKAPARTTAPRRRTPTPEAVAPPTVESPSMAIPDPSPREPAG
jgi:peptidoglycan hydrolase CwlO-like protein